MKYFICTEGDFGGQSHRHSVRRSCDALQTNFRKASALWPGLLALALLANLLELAARKGWLPKVG